MRTCLPLLLCGFLFLTTGCATIVRGDKQTVKIVTEPPGATLLVDGKEFVTPADVVLKRKQAHDMTIALAGYQTIEFKLKANWDGGGVVAIALDAAIPGGSAMFLIDFIAGADRKFDQVATIKLPPASSATSQPAVRLYEYKGKLLSKPDYDAAVEKDRIFKTRKPTAATKPST
jgi:hypothetical protein